MGHDDQLMSPPPQSSHSLHQVQEPRALGEDYRQLTLAEGQQDDEQAAQPSTHGPDDSDSDSDIVGEMALGAPGEGKDVAALEAAALEEDSATCIWGECGIVFTHLPSLIHHIHNDHIGVHKSNYTCEWSTCQRRGLSQTSRFALISHIRSHTGEKPFTCPLPECDKSFTRSDALAKHMRLQHNISPPAPGRGGSRKRKRGAEDESSTPQSQREGQASKSGGPRPSPPPAAVSAAPLLPNGSFTTFKLEPSPHSGHGQPSSGVANGYPPRSPSPVLPPRLPRQHRDLAPNDSAAGNPDQGHNPGDQDDPGYASSVSDMLPTHLMPHYEQDTGLVLGRTPAMVMYLLMKAKHRYALEQREGLAEELRVVKAELKKEKEEKERALDLVLSGMFGPQAEMVVGPVQPPLGMGVSSAGSLVANGPESAVVHPVMNGNGR